MLYDVFICHASEDKKEIVSPLANLLKSKHIEVWYDEFSLKPGDSLRQSIDKGLLKSRFGIVILSKFFFNKKWTNWELDGLLQKQFTTNNSLIIPIWHKIKKDEIARYSLPLVDKVAIITENKNIEDISNEIINVINPEGSTLLFARDKIIISGINPPVITDDWWLDIVEYSGSNSMEGTFQESMGWGFWGFPIPEKGISPKTRGNRLGQAALQYLWQNKINKLKICQITNPKEIIKFIKKQPGLFETCLNYPHFLAIYAPQLMIKNFGGPFEEIFNIMYENSLNKHIIEKNNNSISGRGLTTNGEIPLCDEIVALRNDLFGNYQSAHIACFYFQGTTMGPSNDMYDNIDYISWLLSNNSLWLPKNVHNILLEGTKEWGMWYWDRNGSRSTNYKVDDNTGHLFIKMINAKNYKNFKLTNKAYKDLYNRLSYSKKLLKLEIDDDYLFELFLKNNFIKSFIENRKKK